MIRCACDKRTRAFVDGKYVKTFSGFSRRAKIKLDQLETAASIEDHALLSENRFKALAFHASSATSHVCGKINDVRASCRMMIRKAGVSEMRYEAPKTLEEAITLLSGANGQARVLAGGTDLLIQMRSGRADPGLLVDVKSIAEMKSIAAEAGGYRVGAAVTCMELIENEAFARAWPGIVDGVKYIGSIQVKGRATMGGNLCNASPAADSVPALIAAGAVVCIAGPLGKREAPVEEFVAGPGKTTLASGELVVSFLLPRRTPHSGDAYLRFTPRTEMDIAVVGAAVNLTLDDKGVCSRARVSLGAVAARALLVPEAAAALIGTRVDAAALARLAAAASAACRPIDDKRGTKEFRIKVAGVMAQRAASIALERARRQS